MIVPQYWAEARIQKRFSDRQVTVRRFGWSDTSQADAEQHARQRVAEAFDRIVNGEPLPRREKKVRYNGADGLPIREEILERVEDCVITRNSYGARCLNCPDVFFADIDYQDRIPRIGLVLLVLIIGLLPLAIWIGRQSGFLVAAAIYGSALFTSMSLVNFLFRMWTELKGGPATVATKRLESFIAKHPRWHIRAYETPHGLRLLAMHQLFDPRSAEVEQAFRFLNVDPTYRVMCQKQNCFRARLTAKPWRIGISTRLRPRPGVWPVREEFLPGRTRWVAEYESSARHFSACRYVGSFGSGVNDPKAERIRRYHDQVCQAQADLELA